MKKIMLILSCLMLSGCGSSTAQRSLEIKNLPPEPRIQEAPLADELANLPELDGNKITIAIYSFQDKTGQRKPADNIANLSSAVTQGAEVWVIDALSKAGKGSWFEVLERIGLDNLVKERQLIRNTRQVYEKELPNGPTPLKPMKFAGLILEGGIIGYDSNVAVGGLGARYLGIGAQTEYRVDTVTVVMRIVSVNNGKVLLSVATEKSIASTRAGVDVFKFLDLGTKLIESETGFSVNEPVNYAVRAAIEAGVVEIINDGERKGLWKFKQKQKVVEAKPIISTPVTPEIVVKAKPPVIPKPSPKQLVKKPVVVVVTKPNNNPPKGEITVSSVSKRVLEKDGIIPTKPKMSLPKSRPTLHERMCNPDIFRITQVCAKDTEELRKLLKVGVEDHIAYSEKLKNIVKYQGYDVCNKDSICFKNVAEMYRWESWQDWLEHVNKGKKWNKIK